VPTWINVTGANGTPAPPESFGDSAAYDPWMNASIYFGGCTNFLCADPSNQTWAFSHGAWENLTDPANAPPGRDYAAMDYDAHAGGVLLFGGSNATADLDDTWLFVNGSWTNVTYYGASPPAVYGAGMAYDPQPEENGSVLFGGYGPEGYSNSTWVWQDNAGWVPLTSSSLAPPEVADTSLAFDASDGYIVQFGGYLETGGTDDATWELYSGQWWEVQPPNPPYPRELDTLLYVPSLNGVLLTDGWSGTAELNNTWVFSDGSWIKESPGTIFPARDSSGLALDGTGTTPILFGGDNLTTIFNDTWAYEIAPVAILGDSTTTAEVGAPVTFTATVVFGTAPYTVEFSFGNGVDALASGPGPTISVEHAFAQPGNYTVNLTLTDAVGANASALTPIGVTVTPGPAVVVQATPASTDVGLPVSFSSALTSPGTAPVLYQWKFGDGGNASSMNASHTYTSAGRYPVTLLVTDADLATASAGLTETVNAAPTVLLGAGTLAPAATVNDSFFANVTGGTGPITYAWLFGTAGAASPEPAPEHAFPSSGTYTVQVWANDSVGGSAHASVTVTASTAPSSGTGPGSGTGGPSSSGTPWWFWPGLVGLLIVGVAGVALLARRRSTG
jgi:PKD repeat protein